MVVASAIIAAAALGYGVYAGERQAEASRTGLRLQEKAQKDAETAAVRDAKIAEEADNRARQKTPDLNVLLSDQAKPPGPSSINSDRLLLGRPGLLGF